MNSFLFIPLALGMFLIPSNGWTQSGTASSHPMHPLQLLSNPFEPVRFLQINYSNPYGVKSIQDIRFSINQPTPRGFLNVELQRIGIRGYSQFHFSLGYCLRIGDDYLGGVFLNADLFPVFASNKYRISPGSSFYTSFHRSDRFKLDLFVINWTSLWQNKSLQKQKPSVSLITGIQSHERINIIAGISYTKSYTPLIRVGVKILADESHTIAAGFQTGPPGFWLGYTLTMKDFIFCLTIQTGGAFGYEPGSSVKYIFN